MGLKFILHIGVSSVMRVEYHFMCLKHSFALLIHYRGKSKASFIKCCDLLKWRFGKFTYGVSKHRSLEEYVFCGKLWMLWYFSKQGYVWMKCYTMHHDLITCGKVWDNHLGYCCILFLSAARPWYPRVLGKEDSCEGDDGGIYVLCVVLLPCGNWT